MNNLMNNVRIFLLTANVALLAGIVIESYINNSWDTLKIMATIVVALNIIRFSMVRTNKSETKTNIVPPKQNEPEHQ
jgi:hypothetical protein